jgi:hypothetical protein
VRLRSIPKTVSAMTGANTRCILLSTQGCSISSRGSLSTPAAQCWTHLSLFAASTISTSGSPRITSASAAAALISAGSREVTRSAFGAACRIRSISSGVSLTVTRTRTRPAEGEGSKSG